MNRKIFGYAVALVFLAFLTMFPLTVGALANGSASTTWGNIKIGADFAKLAPPLNFYTRLVVPFFPQVSPDSPITDWKLSMNCGQASVLNCVGYLKRVCYPYPAIVIADENKWLAKTYNEPRYLNKYGYFTGGDKIVRLEGLARNYWGLKNSVATTNYCASIDALYNELKVGRPVVVEVMTNMVSAPDDNNTYHFMVLVGLSIGTNDTNSYVWVNDVGKTAGKSIKYTLQQFKKSWATSGNHCVFIRP